MEYRQKNLKELRTAMLGKTKEEIDKKIENGTILFDADKYRIIPNDLTLAKEYATFTPQYARELRDKVRPYRTIGNTALTRLDELLSEGGEIVNISTEKFYLYERSIEYNTPSTLVVVSLLVPVSYYYPNGMTEMLYFMWNGRFKRGTCAMNRRREQALFDSYGFDDEDIKKLRETAEEAKKEKA